MLLKLVLFFIVLGLLGFIGLLIHGTLTAYRPSEKISLEHKGKGSENLPDELVFMIWNIGYSGLGEESDFFYDGGKTVIPPKTNVEKNKNGILTYVRESNYADFILLQEVDKKSKRSHNIDQFNGLSEALESFTSAYAINYQVGYLPYPFNEPMGNILSGLASFSKYNPVENTRFQFPGSYSWPKSNYFLKRCFLLQRFKAKGGKDLVVINTHNSAYDSGGTLKSQEMEYLKNVLLEEYQKGNYVVVGGDWNQIPSNFDNNTFKKTEETYEQIPIPSDYLPGDWQWVYDETVATNRKLEEPYDAAKTFTTVIDFFLVSPNVRVEAVVGENLDFKFSDHQPVFMKVVLE